MAARMSSLLLMRSSEHERRMAFISERFGLKLIARSPIGEECHTLLPNYRVRF